MRAHLPTSLLCLLALLGCACGASTVPTSAAPVTATASADYEVHEWGLVRGGDADTLRVGAIAPPVTYAPMVVDKPVLYFHVAAPLTLASVVVEMPAGGRLREVWPLVPFGETARWNDVSLAHGRCAPSPLPTATEAPCAQLGGEACESSSLALVRTSDAACVTTSGATEQFLFYRAHATRFTPPLAFTRTSGDDVTVTNEGDAPIPGLLVRLWSDGMRTRALAVAPPAPHASILVGSDFDAQAAVDEDVDRPVADDERSLPSSVGAARQAIRATMSELGLTAPEVDAFLGAWSDTLFASGGAVPSDGLVDRLSVDGEPAPRESFLYFLPEPSVDGIARLRFDPAPRAVRRALAVWSPLQRTGTSH